MTVNPAGFVSPYDGGVPRIVTGKAITAVVSGGGLVFASGAADAVSSGLNSFAASDILIAGGASGAAFNGVALQTTTSGNYLGVVTRGHVIIRAGGVIVGGQIVAAVGADAVVPTGSVAAAYLVAQHKMGRAWTNATSGGYALIELTP